MCPCYSEKKITIPVLIEVKNGDNIRNIITLKIIEREDDLVLFRLKTLTDWNAVVFYEANERMFNDIKKIDHAPQ